MGKRPMTAGSKTIKDLFGTDNSTNTILDYDGKFVIPQYQRPYSWQAENQQCEQLWIDINDFLETKSKGRTYFFGSIIINDDGEECKVIDGQQRITTFMLLLKALQLRIDETIAGMTKDDDEHTKKLKGYLKTRRTEILYCLLNIDEKELDSLLDGSQKWDDFILKYENLSINEDKNYKKDFINIMRAQKISDIENKSYEIKYKQGNNRLTNFYKNFMYFYNQLKFFDSTQLNEFAIGLLGSCSVIVIISYDDDEAIEIFNSLNATGQPLNDADIIAATLYGNAVDKDQFDQNWKALKSDIEKLANQGINFDNLLGQYMYILRADETEAVKMPAVRKYFLDKKKDEGNVYKLKDTNKFIDDFNKLVKIWNDDGEFETSDLTDEAKKEKNRFYTLKRLLNNFNGNFKYFYAAYMFTHENASYKEKNEFVAALLKLFTLLVIERKSYSSDGVKDFLIKLNREIIHDKITTKEIVDKINIRINEIFKKDAVEQKLKEERAAKGVVFLNEYLFTKDNKGILYIPDDEKIEIEHIMPTSGKDKTKNEIMKDAGLTKEEFEQYVEKIGNKILLEKSINAGIGNEWYRCKVQNTVNEKKGYKDSKYPLAQALVEDSKQYDRAYWTKSDIDKATEKAATRITDYIFSKDV